MTKKIKKGAWLLVPVVVFLFLLAVAGNAQALYATPDDRATISLGSATGDVGGYVIIPVSITTTPQTPVMSTINAYIQYDPTVLRYLNQQGYHAPGEGLGSGINAVANLYFVDEVFPQDEPDPYPGFLNITMAENYDLQSGLIPVAGQSVILYIRFDIISYPASGTTPLTLLETDPVRPGEIPIPPTESTVRVLSPTEPHDNPNPPPQQIQDAPVEVPINALNSGTVTVNPPAEPCDLTLATWNPLTAIETQTAQLNVAGSNCPDGTQLSFVVEEYDTGSGNDAVVTNPANATFSSGNAQGTWITEWQDDGVDGVDDPEYFFTATVVGSNPAIEISSPSGILNDDDMLHVSQDEQAPSVTAFTVPVTSTNLSIPIDSFTATDIGGTVTGYMITTSATPPVPEAADWTDSAPSTYTVSADGTYTLYPWAKDAADNVSAVFGTPITVIVDTLAPTVTSTIPANNATNVALNSSITINWSEDINCGTVNTTYVTITPASGLTRTSCSGSQAVFSTSGQSTSTNYSVNITTGVKDVAGNAMTAAYSFAYTISDQDGFISHWKFDETAGTTALDSEGSNNGTIVGATRATEGKYGRALSFDPNNDYVALGYNASLNVFPQAYWSLTAWINPTGNGDPWQSIFVGVYNSPRLTYAPYESIENGINANSIIFGFVGNFDNNPRFLWTIYGKTNSIVPGQWNHVGLVSDGDNHKLYINGILSASAPYEEIIDEVWEQYGFRIGNGDEGETPDVSFSGLIDDVRIYNRTLAPSEMATLGEADTTPPVVTAFTVPATSTNLSIPIDSFTATDIGGTVTDYMITTGATPPVPEAAGWTGTAPETYTVATDGTYTLYPWAKDAADNVSAVFGTPITVIVDTLAPTVTSTIPANNATGIALNSSITINWSENISCSTVDSTSVTINGGVLAVSSCSGSQAVFTPSGQINSQKYDVTVSTEIKDINGNNMAAPYSFSYTTIEVNDPPVVTAFAVPSSSDNFTFPISSFTATDNNGTVAGYLITTDNTPPTPDAAGWTSTAPSTFTVTADETYMLYPWAKDAADNISAVFATPKRVVVYTVPAQTNPIGHWKFDDGSGSIATDSEGGNNGTVKGATWITEGKDEGALWFTSDTNTYVQLPVNPATKIFPTKNWTFSAWIKPTGTGDRSQTIFNGIWHEPWIAYLPWNCEKFDLDNDCVRDPNESGPNEYGSYADSINFGFFDNAGTGFQWKIMTTANVVTLGVWNHVGVTSDGASYIVYVNGIMAGSTPYEAIDGWTHNGYGGYRVGNSIEEENPNESFVGSIDDVRIYNRTLSPSEMATLGEADTTPPVVTAFTATSPSTSLNIPVSSFTATDNKLVTGYMITTSATPPVPEAAGWTGTAPETYTVATDGTYTLYPWAKDAADNVSAVFATPRTVVVDTIAPTTTANPLGGAHSSTQNVILSVNEPSTTYYTTNGETPYEFYDKDGDKKYSDFELLDAVDDQANGKITAEQLQAIQDIWSAGALIKESIIYSSPISISVTTTLKFFSRDVAGNNEDVKTEEYVINIPDTTPPVVTAFTATSPSTSLNIPIIAFTATDARGVTGYKITTTATPPTAGADGWTGTAPETYTVATDGTYTLYPWAKDAADNVSAVFGTPRMVVVDTTAFGVSSTVPVSGATGVALNSNVTITWNKAVKCDTVNAANVTINEGTLGVSSCSGSQAVFTTSGQKNSNTYTATVSTGVKDEAGNVMAAPYSFSYTTAAQADTAKPVTTATPPAGSYSTSKIVALSVVDASPVTTYYTTNGSTPSESSTQYTSPITIATTTTLKFFSKDTANNKEDVKTAEYIIDSTVPVTTASPAGGHYSIAQQVTLAVNKTATTYYTTDGSTPTELSARYSSSIPVSAASTTLKFFSKDAAGNTETVKTEVYKIRMYGLADFIKLKTNWLTSITESDVSENGVVNAQDLGIMMSNWVAI